RPTSFTSEPGGAFSPSSPLTRRWIIMSEEWREGEWKPDEDITGLHDPLRTTDEQWEKMYKGESQGRKLVAAGGALLIFDLLFSILEGIGDWIDGIRDRRDERRRNR
ncbi:MAG: hypothetical protein ACE5IF_05955, partial [Candidatus Bathyarchaeia archaeon]